MKVCLVISNFYPNISKLLMTGATIKLEKYDYKVIYVPGRLVNIVVKPNK